MDLGLTDKSSEETGYLQTGNGSDFIGKLDLNLAACKDEESGEVYNEVHVDLNQLENQGSNVSAAGGGCQGHGFPSTGTTSVQASLVPLDSQHSSPGQPEPCCGDMDRANFVSDSGKLQSSPTDSNSKVEIMDSEAKSKKIQDELETRDFALNSKYGHDESQKEYSDSCSRKLPLHDIEMTENTSQLEKSRLASQETEGEDDGREDLEFSSRTTYTSEEMKVETDIGMMEGMQSDPPKNMTSPLKVQGLSDSLGTSKQKISPPEKSSLDGNGVSSHEHFSPSNTRNKPSRSRMSQSPRRQNLSPGHQRQGRSPSRSPVLHRDSSAHNRRDYRDRSRSRSPYTRDRYRRSPRRRHSPRHRSPPPRYHSNRPFPRGRPWSPPHNRNTGVGRPGKNLFVAGFSFITTEKDLERKFSRFGRVTDVRIVRDKRSGDSRGFGFLSLERDEDADAAIRALDQTEWNGRIVLVEKSKTSAR